MIRDPSLGQYNTPGDITSGRTPTVPFDVSGPTVATSSAAQGGDERTATAQSAHQMLVAAGIMIVIVYLLVIVAGMSQGAGRAVLALFGLAIIILGLGNTKAVIEFVNSKPLTPKAG
jgi:hypothetical protein